MCVCAGVCVCVCVCSVCVCVCMRNVTACIELCTLKLFVAAQIRKDSKYPCCNQHITYNDIITQSADSML